MLNASASLDLLLADLGALVYTHKDVSAEEVGRSLLSARELRALSRSIPSGVGLVVLQTCNRVEVYFHGSYEETLRRLVETLEGLGRDVGRWRRLRGGEVVRHLFRVAAGLESLSVGENEVLGQVREAYRGWLRRGRVDQELSALFERALRVGKRVRRETGLSKGKVGVYSLAVSYASQRLDLRSARVGVVGAGEVCSKLVKMLHDLGVGHVTVLNRTVSRARRLAEKYGYSYAPLSLEGLTGFDVVFSAITRPGRVRVSGPRLVVDLSVPPVFEGENVVFLDELRELASKNAEARIGEVGKAEAIIREEEEKFARHLRERLADSYIAKIMGRIEDIRTREVRRALSVLRARGVGAEACSDVLDALTRAIVNKTFYRVLEDIRLLTYQGDMEHVEYLLSVFADEPAGGRRRLEGG